MKISTSNTATTNTYTKFPPVVNTFIYTQVFGEIDKSNIGIRTGLFTKDSKYAKSVIKVIEMAYNNEFQIEEIQKLHLYFGGSVYITLSNLVEIGVLRCIDMDDDYREHWYCINPFFKQQIESKIRIAARQKELDKSIAEKERLGIYEVLHKLLRTYMDAYHKEKSIILAEARKSERIRKGCMKAVDEMNNLFGIAS